MKTSKRIIAALLLALLAVCLVPAALAESITVWEYQRQLRDLEEKMRALESHPEQAAKLVSDIPDHVTVAAETGAVTVDQKNLKDDLAVFVRTDVNKRAALLKKIHTYVQALNAAAAAYEKPAPDTSSAHDQLSQILSRPEFKKVHGPSAKDALLARIYRWLSRLLRKLKFGGSSAFDLLRLLIYLLVGAAVLLLAIWTIRRLRRPEEELPQREIIPFSPSARGWRAWLGDARSFAQRQDWRNAIHMAYWAGISYLEENGAWKPNRARTPREYLRLVGARAAPYPMLAALTRKLELVWYGYGIAQEADFQETLGQLEKLGCR
jgi:Domain of unknown function (DUF4129)